MYRYEYEYIDTKADVAFVAIMSQYSVEGYSDIIDRRAKDGWRFVTCIPEVQNGHAIIDRIVLVFEKTIAED